MPEHREAAVHNSDFPAPDFDVRDFARTAEGSHRAQLNLGAYESAPLSAIALTCLSYLQVTERATMTHLRSVLVTATHKDARITAFLTTWAFEKYWIADALEQIVLAHEPVGDGRGSGAVFRTPPERTIWESIVANVIGAPMIAVHMTLGTVDEWLTQAAYGRIKELDEHPQLATTIDTFLRIKARQLLFFEAQARYRLTESTRAQRLVRARLRRTAWPLGAKAQPKVDTRLFYHHVFGDAPEALNVVDARIDTLPGQSGRGLMRRAARS